MPAPTTDVTKQLETLGLKPDDLNENAVRVAYKKLALRWHPDRHNADPEEAKEKFIEVNEAYKALVEECKKRNKSRKPRKEDDSSSTRRPFWAGSAPSASSSTSSTPSASSSTSSSTSASSSRASTSKEKVAKTEIPNAKPADASHAKSTSSSSTKSPSAKPADIPSSRVKPSDSQTAKRKDADAHTQETRSHTKTRRSGDRDSSHPSSRAERSHTTTSHGSSAAHKSPRPSKSSYLHSDTDSDASSEDESRDHKHHPHNRSRGKKHSLGEDDYEFIDLGTPLKPIRSPKPLSSSAKDWIFPLHLSLEDLHFGGTHRYRITRTLCAPARSETASHRSAHSSSSTSSSKSQTVQIDIQVAPGWKTGTRIRVPGVGNQRADGSFQDIVFVVAEKPHARFTRAGDDLVLPVRVPWVDAHSRPYPASHMDEDEDSILGHGDDGGGGGGRYRFGFGRWRHNAHAHGSEDDEDEVYVMGLDGEEYTLPIPRTLVEAADGTRIFGAGMPVRRNGKVVGKGDLIIRWEFVFPESDKMQRSRWQTLKDAMHLRFQV